MEDNNIEEYMDSQKALGIIEAIELTSFASEFLKIGFSISDIKELVLMKMQNQRDIEISYINKEMNENINGLSSEQKDCDCPECMNESEDSEL